MAENFFAMIDRVKRNIRKNVKNPQAMIDALELALVRGREDFNQDPVGMTLGSANLGGVGSGLAGLAGITAYHGTPHLFDKFSLSKIGTGEGAQAYGHGLYFADNPAVATEYRRSLSAGTPEILLNGRKIKGSFLNTAANRLALSKDKITSDDLLSYTQNTIDKLSQKDDLLSRAGLIEAKKALSQIQKAKNLSVNYDGQAGNLYKVDIPDDAVARMLEWEKPVSESTIAAIREPVMRRFESGPTNTSGEKLWREMVFNFRNAGSTQPEIDASEYLKSLGVPGIRYFDRGSRSTGEGTMNTVLFDDNLVDILERNGVPMQGLQGLQGINKAPLPR